jgi:hypothetical protein
MASNNFDLLKIDGALYPKNFGPGVPGSFGAHRICSPASCNR